MHKGEIKVLLEQVGDRKFVIATPQPEPRVGSLTMFFSGALGTPALSRFIYEISRSWYFHGFARVK